MPCPGPIVTSPDRIPAALKEELKTHYREIHFLKRTPPPNTPGCENESSCPSGPRTARLPGSCRSPSAVRRGGGGVSAATDYQVNRGFENPVAFCRRGERLFVLEKERNTLLELERFTPGEPMRLLRARAPFNRTTQSITTWSGASIPAPVAS
jgi:hypothetical protein